MKADVNGNQLVKKKIGTQYIWLARQQRGTSGLITIHGGYKMSIIVDSGGCEMLSIQLHFSENCEN
jgi:hypothetical protein